MSKEDYEYNEELYEVGFVEHLKDKAMECDYYKENLERLVNLLKALLKYDGENLWFRGTNEIFVKTDDYKWFCSIVAGKLDLFEED